MKYKVLLIFTIFFYGQTYSQCQDSAIDCTGQCGRFIDLNQDKFCDYSILSIIKRSEENNATIIEKRQEVPIKIAQQEPIQKAIHIAETNKNISEKKTSISESKLAITTIQNTTNFNKKPLSSESPYHLLSILIPILIVAILMKILQIKNIIRNVTYTRFWNAFLLITFLVTAILGMLIVVKINYHLEIPYLRYYYIFHVDFGIAMSIIAFIHLLWHWKYYYKLGKGK